MRVLFHFNKGLSLRAVCMEIENECNIKVLLTAIQNIKKAENSITSAVLNKTVPENSKVISNKVAYPVLDIAVYDWFIKKRH